MSLRSLRLRRDLDRIILSHLERGTVPDAQMVLSELTARVMSRDPGQPGYQAMSYGRELDPDALTIQRNQVSDDLAVLWPALVDALDASLDQLDRFAGERMRQERRLHALEARIQAVAVRKAFSGYLPSYTEAFADLSRIDTTQSSARVDLAHHEATLPIKNAVVGKCTPVLRVDVKAGDPVPETNGDIVVLTRAEGLPWQAIVDRKTGTSKVSLRIALEDLEPGTTEILVKTANLKRTVIEVWYSIETRVKGIYPDDRILRLAGRRTTSGAARIALPPDAKYAELRLIKSEADRYLEATKTLDARWEYVFLVDTISALKSQTASEGTLTSKEIPIPEGATRYWLEADTDGDVTWQFQADGDEWMEAEPGDWLPIGATSTRTTLGLGMTAGSSASTYLDVELSEPNHKVYDIGLLPDSACALHLYRGSSAWLQESWAMTRTGVPVMEWVAATAADSKAFLNIQGTSRDSVWAGTAFSERSVLKAGISVWMNRANNQICRIVTSHPTSVYLNGQQVYSRLAAGTGTLTLPFQSDSHGVNRIEVLVNVTDATPVVVKLGVDPTRIGYACYADWEAMIPCTLFDLVHNRSVEDAPFAIRTKDDGKHVLVLDPTTGIGYQAVFGMTEESVSTLRLQALLTASTLDTGVLPRIRKYELRFVKGE